MEFNRRRITNGLAWAGAALIVAIPAADLIARQFSPGAEPQVAVVQNDPANATPDRPTPATDRPTPATTAPAQTATNTVSTGTGGNAVDSFIESGRPLPSYISNGGGSTATPAATPAPAANPAPAATPTPQPAATTTPPVQTATVSPQQTATPAPAARPVITPPRAVIGFPTPVSERPRIATAPAPAPVATQPIAPPLIIDRPNPVINQPSPVVTADDLDDWESGPLSDFLANRGGQRASPPPSDYNPNGFWLDQGPQGNPRPVYPPAYDDTYYYPFGQ